eukprot:1640245-Pleurochrysis_carterae.AAC.2
MCAAHAARSSGDSISTSARKRAATETSACSGHAKNQLIWLQLIGSDLVHEKLPQILARVEDAGGLGLGAHGVDHVVFVFVGEQVGRAALRQNVVEVDKRALLEDLLVGEEEDHRRALGANPDEHVAQVLLEVVHRVGGGELDLEHLVRADEGGEAREALLAAAADADEHRVAARVVDDTRDPTQVLHGLIEQHQVHHGEGLVVLGQLLGEQAGEVVPSVEGEVHLGVLVDVDERGEEVGRGVERLLVEVA